MYFHRRSAATSATLLSQRLLVAAVFLFTVVIVGTTGFHYLGGERWAWDNCLYMTVITLSTVGFAETLEGMATVPGARLWTVGLIVLGSGTLLYFASTLTALIVEGDLGGYLRRKRMAKDIGNMKDHVVICGVGSTGMRVVEELAATGTDFVAIDRDQDRLRRAVSDLGQDFPAICADATLDTALEDAGIERAYGIVAALHDDRDNLFVTVSARAINPRARIVARSVELSAERKLRRAGADAVVSPNRIGGMRLASEMLRPSVVAFLDRMLRDPDQTLRIEEITIPESSNLAGRTLASTLIRDVTNAMVIAIRNRDGTYRYNPSAEWVIEGGSTLIVIAEPDDLRQLQQGVREGALLRS